MGDAKRQKEIVSTHIVGASHKMPASGFLTEEHRKLNVVLVVPRTYHLVLTVLTTVLALFVVVCSWFFFKKAVVFQVGYVALPLAVAWALIMQALPRNIPWWRYVGQNVTWLRIQGGSDRLVGATALVGVIVIMVQAGFLIAGLINCAYMTPQGLGELVFGADLTCPASVSNWTDVYRTPYFATQTLTYQMCLDDYAFTITYVVLALVVALDLLLVALMQFMSRAQTRALIRATATRELVQQPSSEGAHLLLTNTQNELLEALALDAERPAGLRKIRQFWLSD